MQACLEPNRRRRVEVRQIVPQLEAIRAAALAQRTPIPDEFRCPLSLELMTDPVVAVDGQTYERADIERWLATHDTSPMSGEPLAHKSLVPNHTLKGLIARHAAA